MTTKLGRALLLVTASAVGQTVAGRTPRPCTPIEYRRTQDVASRPRTWDALYRVYKRYGRCEDTDASEGLSESVARILVDHWSTLPRLAELSVDRAFIRFVLGHINASLDTKDVHRIGDMAVKSCPAGLDRLCADIEKQVHAAEAEDTSYRKPKE